MGRMGPGIKLGYNRGTVRKTIVYYMYLYKNSWEDLLIYSSGAGAASALTNGFLCVSFFTADKGC